MTRGGPLLRAAVVCAGAAVLILELLGSRLLAPLFGTTLYVWSALIAVTLLALAIGYWGGGWVADRVEPRAMLARLLVAAGWLVLLIAPVRSAVLPPLADLGMRQGAVAGALILLGPALTLLGGVAPLAAKAAVTGLDSLGGRVGGLYALSTVGSLAGALAAGFVLIPALGVRRLLMATAALLLLPALAHWLAAPRSPERRVWRALAALGLAAALLGGLFRSRYPDSRSDTPWQLLFRADSPYGEVKVAQHRQARVLLLNGSMQTGIELTSRLPVFPYAGAVAALLRTAHPAGGRVLLLGFGGGVLAEHLKGGGYRVESVEIDPVVTGAARDYFVTAPDLPVAEEDARTFLARTPAGSWDAVILDAYAGDTPPPHLLTAEFFALVRRALAPGGAGIANVIGRATGPGGALVRSAGRTLEAVFPWVRGFALEEGDRPTNVLFVFADRPRPLRRLADVPMHPQVATVVRGLLGRPVDLGAGAARVLTDDDNPVEALGVREQELLRAHIHALIPPWLLLAL